MRISKLLLPILLFAGAAGAWVWWTARPAEVTLAAPVRGNAAEVVYATAVVEPVKWAKVTSIIRERIVSLCGCEGMAVVKGDQLAELDSGDARATLAELEARQELARSERDRALQLLERRVVSQQVYDKAQSELIRVNAMIAAQRERLRDYVIVAPMDGEVLRQDGAVGEVAEPGTILFWIGQPAPLQLVAEVNEEDIPQVTGGQTALIRADAYPGAELTARVARVTPKGDPVLKTYRVYLDLPEDTPLRIGMTAEINIVTREKSDVLLLPLAAFDGDTVQTVGADGRVGLRRLTTGIRGTRGRGSWRARRGRQGGAAVRPGVARRRPGDPGRHRLRKLRSGEPPVMLLLTIAGTHVRNRLRQTVVSTLGVALGVGFSVAMAGLMEGSQRDFVATLIEAIPHVEILDERRVPTRQPASLAYDAVAFHGLRPREDLRGIRNPTEALAALRDWVDGSLAERLEGQAVLRYAGQDIGLSLVGVVPERELAVSTIADDMRAGAFTDLASTSNGLVLGDKAAAKLGAHLGDTVTLTSANGLSRPFRIVGLFHTGVTASDEGLAYAPLKAVQILLEKPDVVNSIAIHLAEIGSAAAVAARAERQLGYKAVSWEEANEGLMEAFVVRNVIMYTVVGAILVVAGFGIFNIVSTIVHEKARDIAILKSLGFPEGDIQKIFVFEGLVIGVLGAIAGSGLGYALSSYLASVRFEFTTDVEMTHLPIYFSGLHYVIACLLALVSSGIAGLIPARKAARLNPVDIIRGAT